MNADAYAQKSDRIAFIFRRLFDIRFLLVMAFVASNALEATADEKPKPESNSKSKEEIVRLENGATVILKPIPGSDQVAAISFYDVGFIDEPQGMTQAAHFLEHLVCFSPTASYRQGESFQKLERIGSVNGETLPDYIHYDYIVPKDQLDLVLKVEAERLSSLRIEADTIRREVPRIYSETDFVEKNPATGMVKHAVMAFSQGWQFEETKAYVRGELESIPLDQIRSFHEQTHRPDRLTLIIAGGFDSAETKKQLEQTIGSCQKSAAVERSVIEWEKRPANLTVKWDASVRATCTYFPPPSDPFEQLLLTLVGTVWSNEFAQDAALLRSANMVFVSSVQWRVGRMPFFIYAAAKPNAPSDRIEGLIDEKLRKLIAASGKKWLQQIQMAAPAIIAQTQQDSPESINRGVSMVALQFGGDRKKAVGMVIGQLALNRFTTLRWAGEKPEENLDRLKRLKAEEFSMTLAERLSPKQRRTIRLEAISPKTD